MYFKEFLNQINRYNLEGKEKIFEFFIVFSRFEYALKNGGFITETGGKIFPDWSKFVKSIMNNFNEKDNPQLEKAVEYILSHPPRIQFLDNKIMSWKNRTFQVNEPIIHKLKTHICDIRNNLFHGGKFDGNFEPEIARNYQLLESALIILENWVTISNNINQNFLFPS